MVGPAAGARIGPADTSVMGSLPGGRDGWVERVHRAQAAVAEHLWRTPTLNSDAIDALTGRRVWFKAEGLQRSGSFKVRGMVAQIAALSAEGDEGENDTGLITVSSGNAALGAAFAARAYGRQLVVVMPESAVPEKIAGVKLLGSDVVCEGIDSAQTAFARAADIQRERALHFLHPFDDPDMIAGNATVTLELLADVPDLDFLLAPASGGGLISGAIVAGDIVGSRVRPVAVQPEVANALARSVAESKIVTISSPETIADGLTAPGPGRLNFEIISKAGVEVRTVAEHQILEAFDILVRHLRVVVEPTAAVAMAGLLADPETIPADARVGILLSGSNVRWALLADTLAGLP